MGKKLRKIPGVRNVAKVFDKVVPNEIKPVLPFILPFIPGIGPALGSMQGALASKLAFAGKYAPYLAQGIMAAGTQALTQEDAKAKDLLLTGALAAAPGALSEGLGSLKEAGKLPEFMTKVGKGKDAVSAYEKLQSTLQPESFLGKAGMAATQAGLSQAPIIARMNEQALRDYEEQLREQGIMDSAERRNKIFGYFSNAGYDPNEVNSFLDKYGYAYGGRVGYKEGGGIQALIDYLKEKEDEENEFNLSDFSTGLEGVKSGYEIATGQSLMGSKPQPTRFGLAEGGIPNVMAMRKTIAELIASGVIDEEDVEEAVAQIKNQAMMSMRAPGMADGGVSMTDEGRSGVIYRDEQGNPISKEEFLKRTYEEEFRDTKAGGGLMSLKTGGVPAEMDMRGGGFIPIGAKERADDVPARLSKNEFVMTANAVRSAGNGNINKGAKRMYDLMNKLEAKA